MFAFPWLLCHNIPCASPERLALAQEEAQGFQEIILYAGQLKILPALNPKRVAVANPEVADVQSVAADEIALEPRSPGLTTLFIWDDNGQHAYKLTVFSEELSWVKQHADSIIKELNLPGIFTKINESEGKVLLMGEVTALNDKERLLSALGSLKDKILDLIQLKEEEATLDIDVQVLEMNRDASKTLGFTMPSSISAAEPAGRFSSALRASMEAIFHIFDWPRDNFTARIDALVEEGKARLLSSPRLACQSGKEAELLVGGEKPILTTTVAATTGAQGTAVSYKEFGIKLKIKPTVVEKERIKVNLYIEVSEVGTAEILGSANAPTAKAFPLTKRNASTELFLNSGQTLGIGGLVKEKEEVTVKKTAFLGDIPVIGMLFRKRETKIGGGIGEKGNVELVILLTPTIIQRPLSAQKKASYKSPHPGSGGQASAAPDKKPLNAEDGMGFYIEDLKARIASSMGYPDLARDLDLKGRVKVRLRILADGRIKEALVIDSSGSPLLDNSAVETIKRLAPFPAFPDTVNTKEITIDIPIVYG